MTCSDIKTVGFSSLNLGLLKKVDKGREGKKRERWRWKEVGGKLGYVYNLTGKLSEEQREISTNPGIREMRCKKKESALFKVRRIVKSTENKERSSILSQLSQYSLKNRTRTWIGKKKSVPLETTVSPDHIFHSEENRRPNAASQLAFFCMSLSFLTSRSSVLEVSLPLKFTHEHF